MIDARLIREPPGKTGSISLLAVTHRTLSGLCLALAGLTTAQVSFGAHLPLGTGWLEASLVLVATASTLVSLSRQLPAQNLVLAATIIASIGAFAQAIAMLARFPDGPAFLTRTFATQIPGDFPWWIPFVWIIVILNSRGVAQLILRPCRRTDNYGFRLIGLALALSLVLMIGLELFALDAKENWLRTPTPLSAPLWIDAFPLNIARLSLITLVALVSITPALIHKKPAELPPDYHPLLVWLLLIVLFAADAISHHRWTAAAFSSAAALLAAGLAFLGGARR